MKYIRFSVFVISLFCWACQQNKDYSANNEEKELVLKETYDTMYFQDSVKRYPIWYNSKTDELVFKNKNDSLFEYYDANTKVLTHKINVDPKYWEFMTSPFDELAFFTGNTITFMYDTAYNLKGPIIIWDLENSRVLEQLDINFEYEPEMIGMRFNKQFAPYIDLQNGKIYTLGFNFGNDDQKKYPLDTEVLVEYDIKSGKKKMLPFKFPAITEFLDLCAMQSTTYSCIRGDSIIIGYAMAPDMDVYNVRTQELSRFIVPHAHYDSLAGNSSDVSTNRSMCKQGVLTEFFFGPIKYNPEQDLFYRTYRDKMELMRSDSTYNTEYDKPLGIQVLDHNLNVLGDFPIGPFSPWDELFVVHPTKQGLIHTSVLDRDTIVLHYLNFLYE